MYIITSVKGLNDFSYRGKVHIVSSMRGMWYTALDGKTKWAGKSEVVEEIVDYSIKFWDTKHNQFLVQDFGDVNLRCGNSIFEYPVPESMIKFVQCFNNLNMVECFLRDLYLDYEVKALGYHLYGFPDFGSKYQINCSEDVFWRYVLRLRLLK